MKFWISIIFNKTFLEQSIWICKWVSWWCHRLTIFHGFCSQKWRKSHTFQLRESKTCLISTMNNVCSGIFLDGEMLIHVWAKQIKKFKILYTQCMENCQAMTSSTHSFAHSYLLFMKCFTENYKNSKFHIFLMFYPIYIKFSLFCSKLFTLSIHWINLNLEWISPLSPDERERRVIIPGDDKKMLEVLRGHVVGVVFPRFHKILLHTLQNKHTNEINVYHEK